MAEYPAHYESDVVLRDGSTVRLRPIRSADAGKLLDLHRRLSPESLYFRFFRIPRLDADQMARLCDVDYDDRFGLVAEAGERLVAYACYYRSESDHALAEAAFTVADIVQGRGLGTRLLERLAEIAREQGIDRFESEVMGDNRRMLDVFQHCGFEVVQRVDQGVHHVELLLAPTRIFKDRSAARARQAAVASIAPFFVPRVVAVVGASRRPGRIGAQIFENLRRSFTGTVIPVNPGVAEIGGVAAYARVSDIPGPVDLAVIVVPPDRVAAVVDDCVDKVVKALVVITAGFGETGLAGRQAELALLEKVRAAGIRLVGPNCMGVINTDPSVRLVASFAAIDPPAGRVAFSSQSGALGLAILDYAKRQEIGISSFVSVGNKIDVSGNDLIQYWAEDPKTDVILLYLESFGNPRNFSRIARHVARTKPIVAVKAGRSVSGQRAASSHTGALSAADTAVEALFRQTGVIRTQTLEELFDVASLLSKQPVPRGTSVGILTNGGGPAILAADACEAHGLSLPALGDDTVQALRAFLPSTASVANPVDMIASATAEDYRRAIPLLLDDPGIHSLLVIFLPPLVTDVDAVAVAIADGARKGKDKPVAVVFMSAGSVPAALRELPCYQFPESPAIALGRVAAYGAWRQRPRRELPRLPNVRIEVAQATVRTALARGGGWLTPEEAGRLLTAIGIPMAPARMASSAADAAAVASELGWPVAVKAVGPAILHKSDVGGVILNVPDPAAVRTVVEALEARLGRDTMTGVLVQRMAPEGVEILLGVVQDEAFGALLVYGSGGTLVEVHRDVSFRIHPLEADDPAEMLDDVRGTALLRGFRGNPVADEAAVRDALLRLSALLDVCPEIVEMDINPVRVFSRGLMAVDARIRVDRRAARPTARRVLY